jgi:hypothetical protein
MPIQPLKLQLVPKIRAHPATPLAILPQQTKTQPSIPDNRTTSPHNPHLLILPINNPQQIPIINRIIK